MAVYGALHYTSENQLINYLFNPMLPEESLKLLAYFKISQFKNRVVSLLNKNHFHCKNQDLYYLYIYIAKDVAHSIVVICPMILFCLGQCPVQESPS